MISWFNAPNEGLSPGGQLTLKTLTATENKTYSEEGTAYTSVTVNVEGGGGGDLTTAKMTFYAPSGVEVGIEGTIIASYDGIEYLASGEYNVYNNDQLKAVLFKGEGYINIKKNMYVQEVAVAGGAVIDSDESYFYITVTGDCTITIS